MNLFRFSLFLIGAGALFAQAPVADSRSALVPNTDTPVRMPEYRTRAEWEKRAEHLRKQILSAAGLYPIPEKPPLRSVVTGRIENGDYSIEKVAIETMPGYWLAGNLYRPVGKPGRHPAVASPHGHWNYGRLEHQPLASVPGRAINLARLGFVVFAYDMVGYTDTTQTPHAFGNPKEQLWSFGPLGLQLWNSIRVVDYLASLPDVDPERIGATGASGGATQTFLLTAVDQRVRFSAPVNMISSIMQGGSPCENAPGLRIGANNMEIGALMAPRPMLMVAATGDWTRNTPQVEYPALKKIWELYDAGAQLESVQIDAPHNYNKDSREAVYRFFAKHALKDQNAAAIKERNIRVEKLGDMMVWHARPLPEGALAFDGVRDAWMAMSRKQTAAISDRALMKERLQLALAAEWPVDVQSTPAGERVVLTRTGRGDRVGALIAGPGQPSRVVVHPDGAQAARALPEVKQWLAAGETLLILEAFQTGASKAPRDRSHAHFLTFNKSDDAERIQDILTALAWMRQKGAANLRVSGFGNAALWAAVAAAAAPARVTATQPVSGFTGTDDEFISRCFVPGIQRAGGWTAIQTLLSR